jgi:hypothetical protein
VNETADTFYPGAEIVQAVKPMATALLIMSRAVHSFGVSTKGYYELSPSPSTFEMDETVHL